MTTWILANAALKGTVVLCVALVVAIMLRRRSAAVRHLVWTAAAAAVLALPFLAIGLPALRVRLMSDDSATASGVVFRVFATMAPDVSARTQAGMPVLRGGAAATATGRAS